MECRFESFMEGRSPAQTYDAATRKTALERLMSQVLLEEQLPGSAGQASAESRSAEAAFDEIKKRFSSAQAYQTALRALGMSEKQILHRLEEYESLLAMINTRFRPKAAPGQDEIEQYYQKTFQPEFQRIQGRPAPPLPEVEKQIREILVQRNINELLHRWLEEMRSTQRVRIHTY